MSELLRLGSFEVAIGASTAARPHGSGVLIRSRDVAVLHPLGDAEFYRHGWTSWSPTGWTPLSGDTLGIRDSPGRLLTADDASLETPHVHSGSAVGALAGADGDVLLLGALGLGSPRVGADQATLWGRSQDDDAEWFLAAGPELAVFAEYAALLQERLGRDRRRPHPGRVWCSWYSYFEGVDEELIGRTADDLRGEPFEVLQIDDGWETIVGDWDAGPRFPSGMAATAERISAAGFRPGLWLAPLIALPESTIARERPDLLVHDDHGAPLVAGHNWGSHYFALDTTAPEVLDHLREVFQRVVGWGFGYLKLDFLYAGALPGVRRSQAPRETVYREAIEHLRGVVGDDVYLLGCGAPIVPSLGVLDGLRVGPDVAAYWLNEERADDPSGSGALNSLVNSLHRAWLKPLVDVDPDVVYFRSRRSLLGDAERAVLQDAAEALAFKSTSDPVAWLDERERAAMRTYLDAHPRVEQLARLRYRIGDRVVDFGPVLDGSSGIGAGASIG